ncbi:ATP-dependent Clp protease adapter ClpS [Georgenia sp. TF02-10]|uniref:ATP-dependent Clp protease adapter ClpS n=1 Tax=Georgenia sp. TF02-10 TaxID=2917725 RepID=UPI001FA72F36|nr:ATP-dependent Clp protease adapter ClpS [Georgenia sp. TF02-10]UNX54132.1 ATP-dependent Clp protease adapter ClpS [Georgenia sp. TF02-10]
MSVLAHPTSRAPAGQATPAAPEAPAAPAAPAGQEAPEQAEQQAPERPWRTVVWDDPVNLMSYVTYVFQTYFGYDEPTARRLMLQVHTRGRAVVSRGHREQMETDVTAMHGYGLWATVEEEGE